MAETGAALTDELPEIVSYLGSGVFNTFFDAVRNFQTTTQWTQYKLDKDLLQVEDYLSCRMTALINEAVYNLESYLDEQRLAQFNAAINGMLSSVSDNCGKLNCMLEGG